MVNLSSLIDPAAFAVASNGSGLSQELLQQAQAQAAQSNTALQNVELQSQKNMPAALEAVKGMPPDQALRTMVAMGIPFNDAAKAVTEMTQSKFQGDFLNALPGGAPAPAGGAPSGGQPQPDWPTIGFLGENAGMRGASQYAAQKQALQSVPTPGDSSLTGEDYLKTLTPAMASQAKALSEGRMNLPTGFALKSPQIQALLAATSQYDPSFDVANAPGRIATRKDFTSGKAAQNITALNTAMNHAATLSDAYDALNNGSIPAINGVMNWLGQQTGIGNAQTSATKVSAAAHALSGELAKVFRSTGMAEADIKAWEDKISTKASPAQSKAVLQQAMELMGGRINALGEQYNQGMGTTKQGIELLSPKAQAAYQKLSGGYGQNGGAPAQIQSDAEYDKLPSGSVFIAPDGKKRRKP